MLMPVHKTGENPKWISKEPNYDDFYTIWDTFRTSNPLLTLMVPDRQRDIVRSMINIYRHEMLTLMARLKVMQLVSP